MFRVKSTRAARRRLRGNRLIHFGFAARFRGRSQGHPDRNRGPRLAGIRWCQFRRGGQVRDDLGPCVRRARSERSAQRDHHRTSRSRPGTPAARSSTSRRSTREADRHVEGKPSDVARRAQPRRPLTIAPAERATRRHRALSSGWQGDNSGTTAHVRRQRLRRRADREEPGRLAHHRARDRPHHERRAGPTRSR